MNKLIITEKPSVAQAIAAVVGALARKDGYFEGNGYVVGWCLGHLAQLVSAEAYDPQLSRWRVADLPILPQDWRYRVPQDKRKQFGILRGLMLRDDVSQVINACDAGREGELIFRNLYDLTGCTKPTLRLWLNSMEEVEIRRALGDLRPGSDYDRLFAAARCRERADWLVGINATRLLSVTYHRTLNTGRVVSPTLALLTRREANIAGFVPESFYTAQLHLGSFSAESKLFSNRAEAEEAVVSAGGKCIVTSISQKEKSEAAPALFDLTMLQREANRALGYTAQQTLDYAQSLYEKRLCTYPRTDSRYLTDGMADGVKSLVLCAAGICGLEPPFAVYAEQVCDSAKVSDHHALVPTMSAEDYELDALPAGERELLRLMAAQVLRAVCAPYRWLETSVELACGGVTYSVKGKTVLDPGWRVYDSTERRDSSLPELHEGDELNVLSAEVKEGQTSPPAHFTEGTLLTAMENAGDTPDESERKGLGTPATRAGIIEKLVAAGFIERKKAKKNTALIPTQTGEALSAVLPEQLASAELTSEWERKLIQVECGELSPEAFMAGIEGMVRELCGSYTPMSAIRECIIDRAGKELEKQRTAPVYTQTPDYAREHGELDQYRESKRLNVLCKEAIEQAVRDNYRDNRLDADAVWRDVTAQFGAERAAFVLAMTVREKDFDGRFSRENKAWAKSQPLPPDPEHRGQYCSYVVDKAHPVLTDALVTHARRELEKKPSVKEKLQSAGKPPRSAAKSAVPEL